MSRIHRKIRWWLRLWESALALGFSWLIVRSGTFQLFRKVVSLAPAREWTEKPVQPGTSTPLGADAAVTAISWWAGRIKLATCLIQALALQAMLLRRGIPSQILIGICDGPEITADFHAWVEWQGRVILGEPAKPHTLVCTAEFRDGFRHFLARLRMKQAHNATA